MDAAFAHIVSFPMLAIRNLRTELGESVMVAGQGLLGLIVIQLAALSGGLPVFAADMSATRRKLALQLGADKVFDPSAPDYVESVLSATEFDPKNPEIVSATLATGYGKGINCIVEVTGFATALEQVLKYAAPFARVSLLGCSRIPDTTIDFYRYVALERGDPDGCQYLKPRWGSQLPQTPKRRAYRCGVAVATCHTASSFFELRQL